jgi:hypothetical protein
MDKTKLVSPWIIVAETEREWRQYRLSLGAPSLVGNIVKTKVQNRLYYCGRVIGEYSQIFSLLSSAIHYVDKQLLDDEYVFLTQEEWDKYQLLM